MATFVVSTEHNNYENIIVYDRYINDAFNGWKAVPAEGYVMYDANANDTELDPDTMEERPVTYYYTQLNMPRTYNWANFSWVAVLRSSVDENYIFGGGDNNHEVM
jgi:hypothetical protein